MQGDMCTNCYSPLIFDENLDKFICIYCGKEYDIEYYEYGHRFTEMKEKESEENGL